MCVDTAVKCKTCAGNRISPSSCTCPSGTYEDNVSPTCPSCNYPCATCSGNATTCLSCVSATGGSI